MAAKSKSRKPAKVGGPLKSLHRFSFGQLVLVTLGFAAVGAYLTYQSFAAINTKTYYGSLQLAGEASLGSTVKFKISIDPQPSVETTNHTNIRVMVNCYQDVNGDGQITKNAVPIENGGEMVYVAVSHFTESIQLGGADSPWQERGGPASCTAGLYNYADYGRSIKPVLNVVTGQTAETAFEAAPAR